MLFNIGVGMLVAIITSYICTVYGDKEMIE